MTLNGFKLNDKMLRKKNRLINRANAQGQNDVHSASNRKSSLKVPSYGRGGYQDETDSDDVESQADDQIQDPPHNTEFDNYQQDLQN